MNSEFLLPNIVVMYWIMKLPRKADYFTAELEHCVYVAHIAVGVIIRVGQFKLVKKHWKQCTGEGTPICCRLHP